MADYTKYPYIAIIGDMKDSRTLVNRKGTQENFISLIEKINEIYKPDIAASFAITSGDEVQGLLKMSDNLLKIIFKIELEMSPVEFRFGVGFGDLSTDLNQSNSLQNDGPAYHRARKMIEVIETSESQYSKAELNILFCSEDSPSQTDQLINAALSLSTVIKTGWTNRQKDIIAAYLKNDENQYKTAESLDIGQSSVSKTLNNTHYYSFKQSYNAIQTYIKNGK